MKFNKKITVTALSTVLGLGLVGSISGAVAWYQYSTRATTSIIGTSTGNGGTLQIRYGNSGAWLRDLVTNDVTPYIDPEDPSQGRVFNGEYQPVTFGALNADSDLPTRGAGTTEDPTVPAAYKQPIYGEATMSNWAKAADRSDYYQYTVQLQSLQLSAGGDYARVSMPVYLSNITINNHASTSTDSWYGKDVSSAVRVHISVDESERTGESDGGHRSFLISKNSLGESGLPTNGKLDLDGDGQIDQTEGYEWEERTPITYGDGVQKSHYIAETGFVATKDANGDIASGTIIAYTPATNVGTTTLTITIWLEGWAQLDENNPVADVDAMWNPANRNGAKFDVGFTFDVGNNAF